MVPNESKVSSTPATTDRRVQIKGIREGLLATFGEGEWLELQDALLAYIQEQAAFFKGARLAIDVGNHVVHAAEMGRLRDKLSDLGVSLWAVLSNSPVTERTAQVLGLATRLPLPRPERAARRGETELEGENAVLVQRTLRSGYRLSTRGHVVVIGEVNPGAEIYAGGSVVVWGRLRGTVHAGTEGNTQAVICALEMAPVQLRIADQMAVVQTGKRRKNEPMMARLENGQIVLEPWKHK
ncbi:MAG: septum site-determining protein MinC [Thermanaerothrix sp.]|nr:septum site-determining protein MinC [Thermanaerothrix sp.]